MSRLNTVLGFLNHYRYLIVTVAGIAIVGFIDDNSFVRRVQLDMQISELEYEIARHNANDESARRQLRELQHNPKAIEKIARERYFMQADGEDIYVLSDDEKPETDDNETTE